MPKNGSSIDVPVPLPYKGVSRYFARGTQPEGTVFDSLNILPFDRQGRRRPAQRGGAGQIEQFGDATPVPLLHVGSYANTFVGQALSGTVFSDSFAYSDGNIGAVSSGVWVAYKTDITLHGVAQESDMTVSSSRAVAAIAGTSGNGGAAMRASSGTLVSTRPYALRSSFTITSVPVNTTPKYVIITRANLAGTPSTDRINVVYTPFNGDLRITKGNTLATALTGGDLTSGTSSATITAITVVGTHTLEVRWSGNTFTVYFDGAATAVTGVCPTFSTNTGTGFIQITQGFSLNHLATEDFIITQDSATDVQFNRTALKMVATASTNTYVGDTPDNMNVAIGSASFPIAGSAVYVSAATLNGVTYIVDGTNIRQLTLSNNTMTAYSASAGTAPTSTSIAAAWRGRLILSGSSTDPQNIFASKVGDPTNWDYLVSPATETMAWQANTGTLGRIGQPVHALIPVSDDLMIVGCEQSVWAIRGDLAAHGSIDNISEFVGIVNNTSWCRAADGSLYWLGPNGFYRANPDGTNPTELSRDLYPQFFVNVDRQKNWISVMYDPSRYGVWIFISPYNSANAPGTHIFYDIINGGFWPIQFTNLAAAGPTSAIYWDGFDTNSRYPVLGGYTGQLTALSFTNRYDATATVNNAISAYVILGPFSITPIQNAVLTTLNFTGGDLRSGDDASSWNLNWEVRAGATAYDVTEGTPALSFSGNIGSSNTMLTEYPRIRGTFFTIKHQNANAGDYFSLENITATFIPAGEMRE